MKILTSSLCVLILSISLLHAQDQQYFEYADHLAISSDYYGMIPINPNSAYLIQNADIVRIDGKTKTSIYDSGLERSQFNIFTSPEDTIIYMYDYFDVHQSIFNVTRIKIQNGNTDIIGSIDDYYYGNNPTLRLLIQDIIIDSSAQTLAFASEGVYRLEENLDTFFISDLAIPFGSELIQNADKDIFMLNNNSMTPILADYSYGPTLQFNEIFIKIKFVNDQFYVMHRDHIAMYTSDWENTNNRISIDLSFGPPTDFVISDDNTSAILLQDSNQGPAQTVKYVFQSTMPELLYQESLVDAAYSNIKMKDNFIYTIGKHREVPVLGIQANEFTTNNARANLILEDVSITYTLDVEDNCNSSCNNYSYDIECTLTNNSDMAITNYTLAAYEFPLTFSTYFPTLFAGFNRDTTIMTGETIRFYGTYNSKHFFNTFPIEIMGSNFALDADFDDSFVEFTDIVLSTSGPAKPSLPFQIYPNPAQSNVSLESAEPIFKVDVYNANGMLVKMIQSKQAITQVELPELSNGFYTLKIWDRENKKYGIQKVMIQK